MGSRRLKIGIQLPEAERPVRWQELLRMAQLIEGSGFDSIWVGDHLLYRSQSGESRGPWETWSLLAALAVATERVEIGPLVACTAFHNPGIIAKKAETIDEISGGRLILGLGAGWNEPEFAAFGFPYDHRAARFEEAFTIICELLREGEADFRGSYYTVSDCEIVPRGPRAGRIPLLIGSVGPRVLRATLPYVDAWNAWYADFNNDLEAYVRLNQRIDQASLDVGRDPAEIERTIALLIGLTGSRGRMAGDAHEQSIQPLSGTPEELAAQVQRFVDAGASHIQLVLDPITEESIEEASTILPHLDRS
jgi:alkanesulfonate monooxygenase SsuD/methylene tetrahydromethanopterin reductase-like flavin-dependent oxidoreductase (luciferase family)